MNECTCKSNIEYLCDYCRKCKKCICKCIHDLKKFSKIYIMNNCECFAPDVDNICSKCNGCMNCSSKF